MTADSSLPPLFEFPVTGTPEGASSSLLCNFELGVRPLLNSTLTQVNDLMGSHRRLVIPKLTSHLPPSFKAEGTKIRVIKAFS